MHAQEWKMKWMTDKHASFLRKFWASNLYMYAALTLAKHNNYKGSTKLF